LHLGGSAISWAVQTPPTAIVGVTKAAANLGPCVGIPFSPGERNRSLIERPANSAPGRATRARRRFLPGGANDPYRDCAATVTLPAWAAVDACGVIAAAVATSAGSGRAYS